MPEGQETCYLPGVEIMVICLLDYGYYWCQLSASGVAREKEGMRFELLVHFSANNKILILKFDKTVGTVLKLVVMIRHTLGFFVNS